MAAGPPATAGGSGGGGVLARALALFKRYKRLVQAVVLALIALFLGADVTRSWSKLAGQVISVQWGLLLAAFAVLVAQEVSYGFIWRGILGRMGSRLDAVSAQRIYLGAEFVRYIPGNVLHVITRVLWAEQRGVPKATGFASMVVELATKITSAALVFAVSLFFWRDSGAIAQAVPSWALPAIGAVGVPLLLLGLHPRLLTWALNAGLRKLKRPPVEFALRYRDVLIVTLYWSLSWMLAGVGFYLLVRALTQAPLPAAAIIIAMGIYAIGWDVGFLTFVTPSGLGFREVVIAYLVAAALLGSVGAAAIAVGTVVAFAARLLSTGAELLCIAVAHAIPGARPVVPERA